MDRVVRGWTALGRGLPKLAGREETTQEILSRSEFVFFVQAEHLGLWREFGAVEGRARIGNAEPLGCIVAVFFLDDSVGLSHKRRARGQVVGIGRDEVNPVFIEVIESQCLRGASKTPGKRRCGDLYEAALAKPFMHAVRMALDGVIALRVRDDGMHVSDLHLVEGVAYALGDHQIRELDEKILLLVDGVLRLVVERVFNVVEGEMEVAAKSERKSASEVLLEFGQALGVYGRIEVISMI